MLLPWLAATLLATSRTPAQSPDTAQLSIAAAPHAPVADRHTVTATGFDFGTVASQIAGDQAQLVAVPRPARNAIYIELLGSAGVSALNYERQVSRILRLRLGAGSWGSENLFESYEYIAAPVTLSAVRGEGSHHLEYGGGVLMGTKSRTNYFDDVSVNTNFFTLSGLVGYRYQKPGRGFLIRAGFTPLFGLGSADTAYPESGVFPSAGVSFGYAF